MSIYPTPGLNMYASGIDGCGTTSRVISTFAVRLSLARHLHAVDFNNSIAEAESGTRGRRSFESCRYVRVCFASVKIGLDGRANTGVLRTLIGFQFVVLFAVVIV